MATNITVFIPFLDAPNLNYSTDPRAQEKYIRHESDCVQIIEAYRKAYDMNNVFIKWRTPKACTSPKDYWPDIIFQIANANLVIFPPHTSTLCHKQHLLISLLCDEMHVHYVELTDADLRRIHE